MAEHTIDDTLYAEIFMQPTLEALLALSAGGFERFVAYVFTRAGYFVENVATQYGLGIDLKLYHPRKPGASHGGHSNRPIAYVQVKRFQPQSLVGSPTILGFMGSLALGHVPGYLVTTSDFTRPAYALAARSGQARLMNVEYLLRYIAYVRGSRYDGSTAELIEPDHLLAATAQRLAKQPLLRTLAISNNKGGVGKTTTAFHLGAALATQGQRILLIDMDAQANLSTLIRRVPGRTLPSPHLADYFAGRKELGALIQPTPHERISLIQAHPSLRLLDTGGSAQPTTELRFIGDVYSESIHQSFDWVIMDTPPAMTLNTRAALAAADAMIVPIVPDGVALDGLNNLFDTIVTMQGLTGSISHVIGGLVTRWEERNVPMRLALPTVSDYLKAQGSDLLTTRIPEDRNITRAQTEQRDIFASILHGSPGINAYQALAEEVLTYASHS